MIEALCGNHNVATVNLLNILNRQLAGCAAFYKFTDFHGTHIQCIDKTAHQRLCVIEGGGYRRDYLHAMAQRVEVADDKMPIIEGLKWRSGRSSHL